MNLALVAFVAGAVLLARLPELPSFLTQTLLVAAAIVLLASGWRRTGAGALGLAFGVIYAAAYADARLASRLPAPLAGDDLRLTGMVSSLPQQSGRIQQFRFRLDECASCWSPGSTVVLSVYDPDLDIRPGERWSLTARLERPRGTVNPGLFDYDGWLLAEDISARGYVRAVPAPERVMHPKLDSLVVRFRGAIVERINAAVPDDSLRGLLVALTIGESGAIGDDNWLKLSATGTNHLLIISGLHVGLVAGAGFRLARLVGAGPQFAGVLSLLGSFAYGLIAGMGLPVQRSLVMTAVVVAGVVLSRQVPPSSMFCLALAAVTFLNPLASLSSGFWLSFGAVFVLLYAFGAVSRGMPDSVRRWCADLLQSQWIVFAGALPILALTVSQISGVSMVANLVAIPWVSLFVIPLLLIAVMFVPLSPEIAEEIFVGASHSLRAIWIFVERLAAADAIAVFPALPIFTVICAVAGSLLLITPRGFLPRWPGLLLWMPLLKPVGSENHPLNAMAVRAIDVGQGLAVLVQTPDYSLLYDAGPRFGSRFDAGERIVTPLLRRHGVTRLDAFIVSHSDIDHAGGAPAIRRNFFIREMISSDGSSARDCRARDQWRQGATTITIVPVVSGSVISGSDNDRSCVVLVSHAFDGDVVTVLLPGDIERAGERRLSEIPLPPIDLMLVPHHGSLSSSTPMFLNHVAPAIAIASAGYRNRFGHPDEAVVDRYRHRGIPLYNTATSGAVMIRWQRDGPVEIGEGRIESGRFWYD